MEREFFLTQMEENTKFNLIFPFHINHDKKIGNMTFNIECGVYHKHNFEDVLRVAFSEPFAFYLSEDDAEFYSKQEIEFIEKIITCEKEKIEKGYEMVNLNLNDEVYEYLNKYKTIHNCTTEEAITLILKTMIKELEEKRKKGDFSLEEKINE